MSLRRARRNTHRRDAGEDLGSVPLAERDSARPVHHVAPRRAFHRRCLGREKPLVPPRDSLSGYGSSDWRLGGSWWLVTARSWYSREDKQRPGLAGQDASHDALRSHLPNASWPKTSIDCHWWELDMRAEKYR